MIKVTDNPALAKLFPAYLTKGNQCSCLNNTCSECGEKFPNEAAPEFMQEGIVVKCPNCGAWRRRCGSIAMANSDVCRKHLGHRQYSLYTKLASHIADISIDELLALDTDQWDLTTEFNLAKVALSAQLEQGKITSEQLLDNLQKFFKIAELKKKIESGETLQIKYDDETYQQLRAKWRKMLFTLEGIMQEELSVHPGFESKEKRSEFIRTCFARLKKQTELPASDSSGTIIPSRML